MELLVFALVYGLFALLPLLAVYYLRAISHPLGELVEASRERP